MRVVRCDQMLCTRDAGTACLEKKGVLVLYGKVKDISVSLCRGLEHHPLESRVSLPRKLGRRILIRCSSCANI